MSMVSQESLRSSRTEPRDTRNTLSSDEETDTWRTFPSTFMSLVTPAGKFSGGKKIFGLLVENSASIEFVSAYWNRVIQELVY